MNLNAVLITGAAGDIGRGMSKIIRDIPWIKNLYGMDINDQFPATYFYDDFVKCPGIKEGNYLTFLSEIIKRYGIQLIIPASEIEIRFFNEQRISHIKNIPILMASFNIMDLGFDKLKTARFLENSHLPFPWTFKVKDAGDIKTPCIVKSRSGAGSKDVNIVTDMNIDYYKSQHPNWIFQEMLLPDNEEYTCGVFKSSKGILKTINLRRVLHGDKTGYAEVIEDKEIEDLIKDICIKLNFQGSINIQLRIVKKKGPVIFEINPRFSSTLVFRHKLGFRDLEWAIMDKIGCLKTFDYDQKKSMNKKIFRSEQEIIY